MKRLWRLINDARPKTLFILCYLFIIFLFLVSCNSNLDVNIDKHTIVTDNSDNQDMWSMDFENMQGRTNLGLFETELLYFEAEKGIAYYYLCNYETGVTKKIASINNFLTQGRGRIQIEDKLYFYLTTLNGENCLYQVDFTNEKMRLINTNQNTVKFILMTSFNGEALALQGNMEQNAYESYVEKIGENSCERIILQGRNESRQIISISGDDQYLYLLESLTENQYTQYYLSWYDIDYRFVNEINITEIVDNFPSSVYNMYASHGYFYLHDLSIHAQICKVNGDKAEVIFSEMSKQIEYIRGGEPDSQERFFFKRGSNEIYRLNTETGRFDTLVYELDNELFTLRTAIQYKDYIFIAKDAIDHENSTIKTYLIPLKELNP